MAARMRKTHQDDVRAKIQASQIINRLTDHGFGNCDLSATQVQALKIVLGKAVADLSAVQLTGDADNPVELVTSIKLIDGDGDNSASA